MICLIFTFTPQRDSCGGGGQVWLIGRLGIGVKIVAPPTQLGLCLCVSSPLFPQTTFRKVNRQMLKRRCKKLTLQPETNSANNEICRYDLDLLHT